MMKLANISNDIYSLFPSAHFETINNELVIFTGMSEDASGRLHPTKDD